jgi:hypothetical protein
MIPGRTRSRSGPARGGPTRIWVSLACAKENGYDEMDELCSKSGERVLARGGSMCRLNLASGLLLHMLRIFQPRMGDCPLVRQRATMQGVLQATNESKTHIQTIVVLLSIQLRLGEVPYGVDNRRVRCQRLPDTDIPIRVVLQNQGSLVWRIHKTMTPRQTDTQSRRSRGRPNDSKASKCANHAREALSFG